MQLNKTHVTFTNAQREVVTHVFIYHMTREDAVSHALTCGALAGSITVQQFNGNSIAAKLERARMPAWLCFMNAALLVASVAIIILF